MRTIAQISDLHFGAHDPRVVDGLLASLDEQNVDLVVLSGDLTQRARRSEFAQAVRFLRRIKQPKLVIPGNHDMPLYNIFGRMLRPFARYERYVAPVRLPANLYRDEAMAVLGVNTARRFTGKNGRVSPEQIDDIRRLFASLPAALFRVLVTHHPLGVPDAEESQELAHRAGRAFDAIAAMGVQVLLSGHHHQAASGLVASPLGERRAVLAITAGTAVSTRLRAGDGNTYNLIRIEPPLLSVSVMAWRDGFVAREATAYRAIDGHWQPA